MKKLKTVGIRNIESIDDYDKEVYDLEIKDNHNYFANGHLVHNCHNVNEYGRSLTNMIIIRTRLSHSKIQNIEFLMTRM